MAKDTISRDLNNFSAVLNEYLSYNRREQGPLLENRANRLRWSLRRKFAEIAPDSSEIESEILSRFRSGQGIRLRMRKGKRVTPKQEIAARKRSVKFLSLSWLMSKWRASRTGQSASIEQKSRTGREIGKVILRTAQGVTSPRVELISLLSGVVVQNRRRGLVEKAIAEQVADMRTYIARKQRDQFRKTVRKWAIGR